MPNDPFVDIGDLSSLGPLRYLDVRDQVAFDAAHAPGAVRVPLDEWDAAAKAADNGFAKTALLGQRAERARARPDGDRRRL
jgi:thiosulfate/3-mercaptopyruvate sulfurtransferase